MSFPRYEKYKDSGVKWLGDVPEHWSVVPIKRIVAVPITDGPHETPQFLDDGVPFVSAEAVSSGRIDFSKIRAYISHEDNARYAQKYSPKQHDIYMVKSGATTGVTAIVEDRTDFNIWSPLAAIRCGDQALPYFVINFLRSQNFLEAITLNWSFGTQQNIGMRVIENLSCAIPPLPEQTTIAAFLDRETTKIDELVAEQRRLMDLLKEKRQAVISHAVTKGLNPDALMKPSGIEWLGDVPAHWEVRRIKTLCKVISKGTTPTTVGGDFADEGIRFLKAENITEHGLSKSPEFYVSEETHSILSRSSLEDRDVLVVIAGATTGKSAVMHKDYLPANTNQAVSFVRLKNSELSCYLCLWIGTSLIRNLIVLNSVQAAQPNLSMEDLGNIPIPLPPVEEVHKIISCLSLATMDIENLIVESQRAMDLLRERRTALISAAVTGQIDVRGLAAATDSEAA